MKDWPKFLCEGVGTFALVLVGAGSIILDAQHPGILGVLGIAIAFGAIVSAVIYSLGHVSGAHINPAVSIGFWMAGRMSPSQLIGYLISQCAGGILAALLLLLLYPLSTTYGQTMPSGSVMETVIWEFVMTFLLMLVIIVMVDSGKKVAPFIGLGVGATVGLEAFIGGPVTGASMNPARSLGPAIAAGDLNHLWIYFAAPIAGAALAIVFWNLVKPTTTTD